MDFNFSTQEVTAVQKRIGQALGLPLHKVIVKNKRAGGAFGGKERMHLALIASVSSVWPKLGFGIGNQNQGLISVWVSKPNFFLLMFFF